MSQREYLTESHKAAISVSVTSRWQDPEFKERMRSAQRAGWAKRQAAKAALLAEQGEPGETQAGEANESEAGTQSRLDLLAAGLEAATGKPVRFVDITDQVKGDTE